MRICWRWSAPNWMVTPETMPRLAGQRNLFELLMIVQNPRNLSRKSSKTFVGLANKVAGGPRDHRCLVTHCSTLV